MKSPLSNFNITNKNLNFEIENKFIKNELKNKSNKVILETISQKKVPVLKKVKPSLIKNESNKSEISTKNVSEENLSSSLNQKENEDEEWETKDFKLIKDFMQQTKIIDNFELCRKKKRNCFKKK